ncbi:MAG: MAPEG family protein [Erythrobacter sp.]
MQAQMLAPAAVLVLWSLIMLLWVVVTRFPAFKKAGVDLGTAEPGGRYQDNEAAMPASVNWKSHNFTHLMEQPTIFYPTVIILAIMGSGAIDVLAAWIYVGLRIAHSLWQSIINTIPMRFMLYLLSTIALLTLAVRAVMATLLFDPSVVPA